MAYDVPKTEGVTWEVSSSVAMFMVAGGKTVGYASIAGHRPTGSIVALGMASKVEADTIEELKEKMEREYLVSLM